MALNLYSLNELDEFSRLSLLDLSFSRLDTYITCPKRYELQYIHKIQQPWSPYLALGSLVHSVLEEAAISGDFSAHSLKLSYESLLSKHDPDGLMEQSMVDRGYSMLAVLANTYTPGDIIGVEKKFEIVIGAGRFIGYIDRIDQQGKDKILICDWKTGKTEISKPKIKNSLQLGLYALAAHKWWPDKQIEASMHYLNSGRIKSHVYDYRELDRVYKRIIRYVFELTNVTKYKYTDNPSACFWCPFATEEYCKLGASRVNRRNVRR